MSLKSMRWMCVLSLVVAVSCSKKDDPLAKEGESCAVDADCESNLACRDSVCVARADSDMGGADGMDMTETPNNTPIEDEDYFIAYTIRDRESTDTLWIYDTSNGTHKKVTPDGADCQLGCWVSEDLGWYLTARANGANFDVMAAPLTGSFALDGALMPIVVDVRRIEVVGNTVSFVREDAGENKAYYRPLDGASDILIGVIGAVNTTEGDWHIDPATNRGVLYNATLQTMDVKIGELGGELTQLSYTIDSSNYQETSGSYFGGSIPTAFSDDGKVMALVTQKAPNDYNLCDNEVDCTGIGQRCGRFGRCSAIEVAVQFFDLSRVTGDPGHLGQPCSADDACGRIHTCDIPAEDAVDQAVCVPRRVVLGLPGQQMQNGQTGCALTEGNENYFYTDLRSPITFGADGGLYLTGARNCGDLDIEHTAILRLTPTSNTIETVFGNAGKDFSADDCFDVVENKVDVTNCTIWVQRAVVSPGGNSLAFIGTNPNVTEPQLAQSNVDLWTVRRDGTQHDWVGDHPEREVVRSITVHPGR